jgi:hypothetical protein
MNIDNALKKLEEEIVEWGEGARVQFSELKKILEAGREPDDFDKRITYLEQYNHAVTGEQMEVIQDRLSALEERVDRAEHAITYATTRREAPAQPCPTGECQHQWTTGSKDYFEWCLKCGVDKPSPQPEPKEEMIRISRKVAEEWFDWCNKCGQSSLGKEEFELYKEFRKTINKEENE